MKMRVHPRLQKAIGSICISAGVLSIANVETIIQEYKSKSRHEYHELVQVSENKWKPRQNSDPIESQQGESFKPLQSELSRSLEQDELQEQNPFAHLSNLDPIQEIMRKGVMSFHREVFRSPNYQDESGYDMISYVVEHTDSTRSTILAYLESADSDSTLGDDCEECERIPFVVFMVSKLDASVYSFYRGGTLVEQSELTPAESNAFVAQRLKGGIPFLSVAR